MQNFSQWLDDFTIEQQINLNDRFTFNRADGAKEVYTVGQIFEFIKAQPEEAQDKFADSLQRGLKAQNLMGYLYSTSKYLKIQQDKQQQKERQPEPAKENRQVDDKPAKDQAEIKDSAAAKFEDLEKRLKDPKTENEALKDYDEFIKQFGSLYQYSANNLMLIASQLKDRGLEFSGIIGSEKSWNEKMSVSVKDDPLYVLVPKDVPLYELETIKREDGSTRNIYKLDDNGKRIPIKDENGKFKTAKRFTLSGKVYSVDQTDAYEKGIMKKGGGLRFPGLNIDQVMLEKIRGELSKSLDVDIYIRPLRGSGSSYSTYKDGRNQIHVNTNIPIDAQLKAILYEAGDRILNKQDFFAKKEPDKLRRLCEAESFAFVVSNQLGIPAEPTKHAGIYLRNGDMECNEVYLKDIFSDVVKAVKTFNDKVDVNKLANEIFDKQNESLKSKFEACKVERSGSDKESNAIATLVMFYSVKDSLNGAYCDKLADLTNRTFGTKFDDDCIMAIRAAVQSGEIKSGQEHYDMIDIYQSYYKESIDEMNDTLKKGNIVMDNSSVDEIKDIMRESDEVAQDFQKFNFDKREEPDFKETKEQANRQARRQ